MEKFRFKSDKKKHTVNMPSLDYGKGSVNTGEMWKDYNYIRRMVLKGMAQNGIESINLVGR